MPTSKAPATKPTTTRKPAAKKPAVPSIEDVFELPKLEETPGSEYLKAPGTVKASDKIRLSKWLIKFEQLADANGELDVHKLDMEEVADFIDYLSEKFAIDSEEFDAWSAEVEEPIATTIQLAFIYGGTLGK